MIQFKFSEDIDGGLYDNMYMYSGVLEAGCLKIRVPRTVCQSYTRGTK